MVIRRGIEGGICVDEIDYSSTSDIPFYSNASMVS